MFSSNYKINYHGKFKTEKPEKGKKHPPYKLSSDAKMDFKTTKDIDYRPFSFAKDHNPYAEIEKNRPKASNLNAKFAGLSKYACDYPNWGPTDKYIVPSLYPLHGMGKIPLRNQTSYKQNFRNPKEIEIKDLENAVEANQNLNSFYK